jgi:hypothetical protein
MNQLIPVGGRKFRERLFPPGISSLVNDLLECVNVHLFNQSRVNGHSSFKEHWLHPSPLTDDY